jgi:starch synthase
VTIGYDEETAHRIEAGSDVYLMPSRFEPCGLNQMYSLAYGTLPVVHETGGLADSVHDATPENIAKGTATGFVFRGYQADRLRSRIERALSLYSDRTMWYRLVRNAMARDFSWRKSAEKYHTVYRAAREKHAAQQVIKTRLASVEAERLTDNRKPAALGRYERSSLPAARCLSDGI